MAAYCWRDITLLISSRIKVNCVNSNFIEIGQVVSVWTSHKHTHKLLPYNISLITDTQITPFILKQTNCPRKSRYLLVKQIKHKIIYSRNIQPQFVVFKEKNIAWLHHIKSIVVPLHCATQLNEELLLQGMWNEIYEMLQL